MPAEMQDINLKHFILAFYFINSMPDASYCQDNTKEKKKKKKRDKKYSFSEWSVSDFSIVGK